MKPERLVRVTRRFRHLGDYDVLKPLEYTLRIRFDDFFANNKAVKEVIRAYNDPQTVLEVLKHTLKIVSASTVRIEVNTSLFDVSRLAQREDERCGMVGTLNTSIDMPNVDPSVFENLPLICGRVAELRFEHECRHSVSLSQQTDRFLRNCIARNVRELEIANYRSHHAPLDGHCDVSEESLLDFCFGRHLSFVGEEKPVVSLWLDWIHLSDQFLNRFIEASEASDSDHSVHLYLRGRDVHDQDLSMCRKAPVLASTSKDYRTGTFTFYGRKHAVRVGYNPKLHYLLVERKDLSSREQFFVESRDFLYEGNGVWKYHVDRFAARNLGKEGMRHGSDLGTSREDAPTSRNCTWSPSVTTSFDRPSLVAIAPTSRRFSAAVARLPPNVCLLHVQEIDFSIFDWRPEHVASRFRDLSDYDLLKPHEYTLSMWFAHGATMHKAVKAVTRVYSDPQTALAIFKHTLMIMSASWVGIHIRASPFDVSRLVQSDAERSGTVGTLSVTADMPDLEPSVFERLPLICGSVTTLYFGHNLGISSSQQTSRFMRNSMARNVRNLETANYVSCKAPSYDYCDISEDSLLEFCFGRLLSFADEENPVVSLWLAWINLSQQFLCRFIEASTEHGEDASEACASDHSVHLYLRGRDAHAQDLSRCQQPPLPGAPVSYRYGTYTFLGKHTVRVGYDPGFHCLLVDRKPRSSTARFFAQTHYFVHEGNGRWKFSAPF